MIEQPPCHVAQHGGQRNLGKGVMFCHVQPPAVTRDTKERKQWGSTLALQRKGLPAAAVQSSRPQPDVQLYAQQFQGFVPQGRCLIMSSQLPFNQPRPSASRWPPQSQWRGTSASRPPPYTVLLEVASAMKRCHDLQCITCM
jgi:hypothetical protein